MHLARVVTVTALVTGLALVPAYAAPKGPKAPKVAKTVKAPKVAKAPKTAGPKGGAARVKTKTPKADVKLARVEAKAAKKSTKSGALTASTSTTSSAVTTETIDFTQGKVGERLTKNTALRTKLESQLMALGYEGTVYQAAYGFKNQGQLVAAINNAQNHSLPFEQLKTLMTGLSVDSTGVVLQANLNPDGTVTMLPPDEATSPAPTQSLGQAKQTIAASTTTETATTAGN